MTKAAAKKTVGDQPSAVSDGILYDAEARNRLAYTAQADGQEYDAAVVFDPLTDERYMQWIREFNLKGDVKTLDQNEQSMEATVRLYDDIAVEMENVEVPDGTDWKDLVPVSEKVNAINNLIAVAVFTPETKAEGPRKLSAVASQTVLTEAWFNNDPLRQTHTLREATIEWKKKYAQIQSKRFKREITRGLRREPKVEFVPQNERLGELYDTMQISATGFAGDNIPLRFKVAVVEFIFESELTPAEKK